MNRRNFIENTLTSAAVLGAGALACTAQNLSPQTNSAFTTGPREVARGRNKQDLDLVFAFVRAGHSDLNRVKEFVAQEPALVLASWDWGGGDWETALGGASHTGHSEIAKYLLDQGARIDAFCAAMLGEREALKALLAANSSVPTTKGPHGYTLLYHAAISGDVGIAEALKPLLPPNAKDYNQALSAAARGGCLEMTKWLLENGVTDPNVPDGFNKTALMFAVEKKLPEIEAVLRSHGAHDGNHP
jgi:Ankyrin repeats (many copies)